VAAWTTFAEQFVLLAQQMAPYLFLGFAVAGLLHVFISEEWVFRQIGEHSFKSVLKAALLGVPLPLCSCGVIPVAASLKRNGASPPAILAFLISTPVTGVDSILATFALMGTFLAVVRPLAGTAVALVAGLVLLFSAVPAVAGKAPTEKPSGVPLGRPLAIRLANAFNYGFVELLSGISRAIMVGLLLGAAISTFVPASALAGVTDKPFLSYLVMVAVGVPMYVCATGSIPIVAALMLKGLSPGAALVFLLAGPATNTVTISVARGLVGARGTIVYLASIVIGSVAFGFLADLLAPAFAAGGPAEHAHHVHAAQGVGTLSIVSGYLLLALVGWHSVKEPVAATVRRLRSVWKGTQAAGVTVLLVPEASCPSCRAKITKALMGVAGVTRVEVDLKKKLVTVEGNGGIARDGLIDELKKVGYEAQPV